MVFSSSVFLILFLPISVSGYYLIKAFFKKSLTVANIWLIIVSLLFYAYGEPEYVFLMIFSILANYGVGRLLLKYEEEKKRRLFVALGITVDLGILFVFKYLGWILNTDLGLWMPIGISFYTFQAISYILDVYRGGYDKDQTKLINVALYIAFFPQLIAGPIVRFSSVSEQINKREHSFDKFSEGIYRFTAGLAKKVLIANQVAQIADLAFNHPSSNSVVLAWVGAVCSVLQIYFDFSGYSDMAIGLGKMFGFTFNENFNYPFVSKSITEYWQRWHISLGEWFRDYLFYPLSLNLGLKLRAKFSAFVSSAVVLGIVWLATGFWHGANWTFVVWGLLQYLVILTEMKSKPSKILSHVKVVLFCILSGVVFKSENLRSSFEFFGCMFNLKGVGLADQKTWYWLSQYGVFIIAALVFSLPVIPALDRVFSKSVACNKIWDVLKFIALILLFVTSVSFTISSDYNPFIYFNF